MIAVFWDADPARHPDWNPIEASRRGILTLVRIAVYANKNLVQLKLCLYELALKSAYIVCAPAYQELDRLLSSRSPASPG